MCHLILFLPVLALPVFWFFPFPTALSIYLFILGISLLLYFKIFQAMRMSPRIGKEAMLGKTGVVINDIDPEGKIKYATEIWDAITDGKKFSKGDKVIIHGFWEMKVLVKEVSIEKQ
jgi:membrane protein implicated in regulation of membrane protease activity